MPATKGKKSGKTVSEAELRRRREQKKADAVSNATQAAEKNQKISDDTFLDVSIVKKNLQSLRIVQILIFMLGGSGAGVLGWTGWAGLLGFVLTHVVLASLVLVFVSFKPKDYFNLDIVSFSYYGAFG